MPNWCNNILEVAEIPDDLMQRCKKVNQYQKIDRLLTYALTLGFAGIVKPTKSLNGEFPATNGDPISLPTQTGETNPQNDAYTTLLEHLNDATFKVLGFEDQNTAKCIELLERIATPLLSYEDILKRCNPQQLVSVTEWLGAENYHYNEDPAVRLKMKFDSLLVQESEETNGDGYSTPVSMNFDLFVSRPLIGFFNWFDVNCQVYGTKWNVGDEIELFEGDVSISFSTAWSPALPIIITIVERYSLSGQFVYYETGNAFAGKMEFNEGEVLEIHEEPISILHDEDGELVESDTIKPDFLSEYI